MNGYEHVTITELEEKLAGTEDALALAITSRDEAREERNKEIIEKHKALERIAILEEDIRKWAIPRAKSD